MPVFFCQKHNLRIDTAEEVFVPAIQEETTNSDSEDKDELSEVLKTRIDTLEISTRILNALQNAGIRTLGGLARKKTEDLLEIEGMGEKGIQEIQVGEMDLR